MAFLHELCSHILAYVEGKEALSALREWFAPHSLELNSCEESAASQIGYKLLRALADESEGYIGELELKQILFASLFPVPSLSVYKQITLEETAPGIVTGSFSSSVAVPAAASLGVGPVMEFV